MNNHEFIKQYGRSSAEKDMDQLKKTQPALSKIMQEHTMNVLETNQFRTDLDLQLMGLKNSFRQSPERQIAIRKIQEAIMWLGVDLEDMFKYNPLPNSYNPQSNTMEPTDGLV